MVPKLRVRGAGRSVTAGVAIFVCRLSESVGFAACRCRVNWSDRLGNLFKTIPSGGDTRARALPSFYWEGQGRAPDGPHRSLAIPVGVANTLPVTGSALGLGSSLVSALHDTTSITDSFTSHHKSLGPLHPPVEIRPRPSTITRWTSRGRRGRMDDNNNKGKEGKGSGIESWGFAGQRPQRPSLDRRL